MAPELAMLAEAIRCEITQALSCMRWLAVIAGGSSFRFRQAEPNIYLVATALGAPYVLTGIIEARNHTLAVPLELSDSCTNEAISADSPFRQHRRSAQPDRHAPCHRT